MLFRWIFACALLIVSLYAQKKPITIETLTERTRPAGAFTGEIVWSPDGKRFAYMQGNRVMLYDMRAKAETELLSLDALEKAAIPPRKNPNDSIGRTGMWAKTVWNGRIPARNCC